MYKNSRVFDPLRYSRAFQKLSKDAGNGSGSEVPTTVVTSSTHFPWGVGRIWAEYRKVGAANRNYFPRPPPRISPTPLPPVTILQVIRKCHRWINIHR